MIASSESTAFFLCQRGKPHKAKLFDFASGQSCNPHISQQWFQLRSEVRFCHFLNELKPCLGYDLDSKEKREKNQTNKKATMGCKGRERGAHKRKKRRKKKKWKQRGKGQRKKKSVFPDKTLEYKWSPYTCPFSLNLITEAIHINGERVSPVLFVCLFSEMS